MEPGQDASGPADHPGVGLRSERLGALPIVQHFLDRAGIETLLARHVPTPDGRSHVPHARALGVLLRSIILEREPVYRQHETVATYAPEAFGLTAQEAAALCDDHIGRALDWLFDADRGTLLTEVVIAVGQAFDVVFDELHNDSTTVRFCGQYAHAKGRSVRGKHAPWITYGHSKDHRPDLKQLLFILTTTKDGAVPCQFRCEAGNASDSLTHEETWDALCKVAGTTSFLYVADAKLCSHDAMSHIHERGGRFVTVLPRSRLEDREFREWVQDHEPIWELVLDRRNPRRRGGPRDRWWVWKAQLASAEGWSVIWVKSSLLALAQAQSRRERIARAQQELERLAQQISGPRPRLRSRRKIRARIDLVLAHWKVARYLDVDLRREQEHRFRQERPGRPGKDTRYRRTSHWRWKLSWTTREDHIAYDEKSAGQYPLLTNDKTLTPRQVLEAHKLQPSIEKRFSQAKSVFEIAPILLKNEARVEAFFLLFFLGLLVQALIERELRRAMARERIESLPLYPEERHTKRPTAEQVLRLFSLAQRHVLTLDGNDALVFDPQLTDLQRQMLGLLGVPEAAYRWAG
jgi:transposase